MLHKTKRMLLLLALLIASLVFGTTIYHLTPQGPGQKVKFIIFTTVDKSNKDKVCSFLEENRANYKMIGDGRTASVHVDDSEAPFLAFKIEPLIRSGEIKAVLIYGRK